MLLVPELEQKEEVGRSSFDPISFAGQKEEHQYLHVQDRKNATMVADGYQLLHQGRTEEAFMLAQVCLKADSYYRHAWSLLGDCHHVQGKLIDALTCYEKAADLDPDGRLERLKIGFVKKNLNTEKHKKPISTNKRLLLSAGILAGTTACLIALLFTFIGKINPARPSKLQATSYSSNEEMDAEPFNVAPVHPSMQMENQSLNHQPIGQQHIMQSQQQLPMTQAPVYSQQPTYQPPQVAPPLPLPLSDHSIQSQQSYQLAPLTPPQSAQNLRIVHNEASYRQEPQQTKPQQDDQNDKELSKQNSEIRRNASDYNGEQQSEVQPPSESVIEITQSSE